MLLLRLPPELAFRLEPLLYERLLPELEWLLLELLRCDEDEE